MGRLPTSENQIFVKELVHEMQNDCTAEHPVQCLGPVWQLESRHLATSCPPGDLRPRHVLGHEFARVSFSQLLVRKLSYQFVPVPDSFKVGDGMSHTCL
jgi:hypothetical protein